MKRLPFVSCAITVIALLAGASVPAFAQYKPVQISLSVTPSDFRGGCPVTLHLTTTFTLPAGTPSEAFSGGFLWLPILPGVSLANAFPELAVTGGTPTTDTIPVTITKTTGGWFLARVKTYAQYGAFQSQSNHAGYKVACIAGIAPGQALTAPSGYGAGRPGGYTPPVAGNTYHVPYPKPRPPYVPPSLHPGPPSPLAPAPAARATLPSRSANARQDIPLPPPGAPRVPTTGLRSSSNLASPQTRAGAGVRVFSKIIAGRCLPGNPTREYFAGAIYMNGKPQVALQYRWIRSDGATGPVISATAVSSHQLLVRDEWDLRTSNYSGWEAMQILSVDGAPANIQSNHATFVCSANAPAARPR